MTDAIDRRQSHEEKILEAGITAAQQTIAHMPGPIKCIKCLDRNDRAAAGYCVCTDCFDSNEV